MADVYCPACAAQLTFAIGTIVVVRRGGIDIIDRGFLTCTGCSLTTEVNAENGDLVDLGGLNVGHLQVPYVPGFEPAPYLTQQPTRLHGRRDS